MAEQKITVHINLDGNQVKRVTMELLSADPSQSDSWEGRYYWNTTLKKARQFNGTVWEDMKGAGGGQSVTVDQTVIEGSKNAVSGNAVHDALVGKEDAFSKNSAFNKNFGTTSGTVAEGNHTHTGIESRLTTVESKVARDKGFYTTPTALSSANPTGADGDFARVGSTDTIWMWDSGTLTWKNTDSVGTGGSTYASGSDTNQVLKWTGSTYAPSQLDWDDVSGKPTIPTLTSQLTNDSNFANQTYVNNQIAALVNAAPATLDTLKELSTALGNDPNFAATVASQLGTKLTASGARYSVQITSGQIQLVGDVLSPGADKVYGTDSAGVRGWYNKPEPGTGGGGGFTVSGTPQENSVVQYVSGAPTWTTTAKVTLSGDATMDDAGVLTLVSSGVTSGTYGGESFIPQFTVDSKGRITGVTNIAVSTGGLNNPLPAGSAAAPSIQFGTTNKGIYAGAANELNTSISGAENTRFNGERIAYRRPANATGVYATFQGYSVGGATHSTRISSNSYLDAALVRQFDNPAMGAAEFYFLSSGTLANNAIGLLLFGPEAEHNARNVMYSSLSGTGGSVVTNFYDTVNIPTLNVTTLGADSISTVNLSATGTVVYQTASNGADVQIRQENTAATGDAYTSLNQYANGGVVGGVITQSATYTSNNQAKRTTLYNTGQGLGVDFACYGSSSAEFRWIFTDANVGVSMVYHKNGHLYMNNATAAPSAPTDGVHLYPEGGKLNLQFADGHVMGLQRGTGWGDPTGTTSKAGFDTSTVTLTQLAGFVKGLYEQLKTMGILSA